MGDGVRRRVGPSFNAGTLGDDNTVSWSNCDRIATLQTVPSTTVIDPKVYARSHFGISSAGLWVEKR